MVLKNFAQINAGGVCVAMLETSGNINAAHMIETAPGENRIGQRWNGTAWETVAPTAAELAALELAQIDQATGMSRSTREAFLTLAAKVGADLPFLAAQETKAAGARAKLTKG